MIFKRNVIAYSSEYYYIKADELQVLKDDTVSTEMVADTEADAIVLLGKENTLVAGRAMVMAAQGNDFIKTKIAYYTYPRAIGFFLDLIKPIKRRFYTPNHTSFTVRLDKFLEADLTRGERNAENAYQWTNKRWAMSREEAQEQYEKLYQSLKENGYNKKYPMFVMINRKLGIKDQLFQGHHRLFICQKLGFETVNVAFWSVPASFKIMNIFIGRKKV